MSTKEQYQEMRRLIEAGWTQGEYARDARGSTISWPNPAATCFCLYGAAFKAGIHSSDLRDATERLIGESPMMFNDEPGRTKEEVLGLVDMLIAEAA